MLRDNLVELIEPMLNSAGADPLALYIHTRTPASDDRLPCLKNPRPEGAESSLTESASSPFQAEPAQSLACQDRVIMAQRMKEARLPWPRTWSFPSLEDALGQHSLLSALPFPLIIKSRYSHRGDLVDRVHNVEQLQALAGQWNQEPFILQEFVHGDGWDIKLWIIDQQIFAARRRTPLEANAPKEDFPIPTEKLPSDWRAITLEIGRVFNLRLYGVDLLLTEQGPIIVDVNSFPGFRCVDGAVSDLLYLIDRLVGQRQATITTPII